MSSQSGLTPQRLEPLHRVAERREDLAARQLAQAQRLVAERSAQLSELQRYAESYHSQPLSANSGRAMMENRELFYARLLDAIRFQTRAVSEAHAAMEVAYTAYLEQRRGRRVMDQLVQRGQAQERRVSERRQQRELDDFALRPAIGAAARGRQ
jgi:flagellar FliJ protein